jgi:hypothetical protein
MRWETARLPITMGEKPYSKPAMNAAGVHETHRRTSHIMARAERAGHSVDATFKVATGPNAQVTGASTKPMDKTLVLDRRLMPVGWSIAVEKKRLCPWANAYAGHSRNHTNSEVSPQPQLAVAVGWVDQTPHHTRTDKTR